MTKYEIENNIQLPPKASRVIARKAADDIRNGEFNSINEAARKYFAEHVSEKPTVSSSDNLQEATNDRLKDFTKYISEDLQNGNQTEHVIKLLNERIKKQLQQQKFNKQ